MNELISSLDGEFLRLHARSLALLEAVTEEKLYWQPRPSPGIFPIHSCGEHLLRSAGVVEQTFGGITANLWDDPFEWTLPESLSTIGRFVDYLGEVEAARLRGFKLFKRDADLFKEISVPPGKMQPLCSLLIETLARAAHHQGRAFATFRLFSDAQLPHL